MRPGIRIINETNYFDWMFTLNASHVHYVNDNHTVIFPEKKTLLAEAILDVADHLHKATECLLRAAELANGQ